MVDRGIAAQTIYGNFLSEISHLSHLYSPPPDRGLPATQPSPNPNQEPQATLLSGCLRPTAPAPHLTHARYLWRSTRSGPTYSRRGPPSSPTERQAQMHLRRSGQRHHQRHQERVLGRRFSKSPAGKPQRQHPTKRRSVQRRRPGPRRAGRHR